MSRQCTFLGKHISTYLLFIGLTSWSCNFRV